MQRHRYSPSMPHQVMPSQYLYLHDTHTRTHAQTNSANKSNSAVHRRLTTKTGKEVVHWGAARCILTRAACTYSLPRIDLILTTTSEKSKDTVCNRANSIQLFSSWWCFSNQRSPLIFVADVFCLFCFFYAQPLSATFLPQDSESSVMCHNSSIIKLAHICLKLCNFVSLSAPSQC